MENNSKLVALQWYPFGYLQIKICKQPDTYCFNIVLHEWTLRVQREAKWALEI